MDEMVGPFDEDSVHGVCLANADVQSPVVASGVKEAPTVDHNKRHASSDMTDIVECKRQKQEGKKFRSTSLYLSFMKVSVCRDS
jgi:hypothetical protein